MLTITHGYYLIKSDVYITISYLCQMGSGESSDLIHFRTLSFICYGVFCVFHKRQS